MAAAIGPVGCFLGVGRRRHRKRQHPPAGGSIFTSACLGMSACSPSTRSSQHRCRSRTASTCQSTGALRSGLGRQQLDSCDHDQQCRVWVACLTAMASVWAPVSAHHMTVASGSIAGGGVPQHMAMCDYGRDFHPHQQPMSGWGSRILGVPAYSSSSATSRSRISSSSDATCGQLRTFTCQPCQNGHQPSQRDGNICSTSSVGFMVLMTLPGAIGRPWTSSFSDATWHFKEDDLYRVGLLCAAACCQAHHVVASGNAVSCCASCCQTYWLS